MEALPPPVVSPEWRGIVERVLRVWTGYQLGIDQGAAGDDAPEKHKWFGDVLTEHTANSRGLNADALEEWLNNILYTDFDLVLDDDSTFPTAHLLLEAYQYWKNSNRVRLNQLLDSLPSEDQLKEAKRASKKGEEQAEEDGEEGGDGNSSDDEESRDNNDDGTERREKRERPPRLTTDDDGWTTINKR